MMTCKDVSTLVSEATLDGQPLSRRMAVWFHLLMCRHCRAFARQIGRLSTAVREAGARAAAEPRDGFEDAIARRLHDR